MITAKTIKHTKNNMTMAFLTLEDLAGTIEIVVFPRDYEKNKLYLEIDNKVFIKGKVSEEDDNPSKLICESIVPFDKTKKELWIQFPDKESFLSDEQNLYQMLSDSEGEDEVVIYLRAEKAMKRLPKNRNIRVNPGLLSILTKKYTEKCIKVIEKPIEKMP